LPLPRQPAWLSAAIIGHLAARNSDDREGVRQKTPGSKIVKRNEETVGGEILATDHQERSRDNLFGSRRVGGWDDHLRDV
jgi:hypothetical protein